MTLEAGIALLMILAWLSSALDHILKDESRHTEEKITS